MGLALWGGPARAAFPERPDGSAAKAKLTKIKVIVGRSRNALVGSVYSHKAGCVGARRARVFEVTGGRRRLLDSGSSMRRGAIGYFRLALGRFKWTRPIGLHEATLAYQTAPGTLNWTESGTNGSNDCVYQGSGQLAIGSERPDAGAIPAAPVWRGWFELGTLRLALEGSEFGPGIHAEAVRDDGTLSGVPSLEGIEGGGNNGSTARVEWNLRPAG